MSIEERASLGEAVRLEPMRLRRMAKRGHQRTKETIIQQIKQFNMMTPVLVWELHRHDDMSQPLDRAASHTRTTHKDHGGQRTNLLVYVWC